MEYYLDLTLLMQHLLLVHPEDSLNLLIINYRQFVFHFENPVRITVAMNDQLVDHTESLFLTVLQLSKINILSIINFIRHIYILYLIHVLKNLSVFVQQQLIFVYSPQRVAKNLIRKVYLLKQLLPGLMYHPIL